MLKKKLLQKAQKKKVVKKVSSVPEAAPVSSKKYLAFLFNIRAPLFDDNSEDDQVPQTDEFDQDNFGSEDGQDLEANPFTDENQKWLKLKKKTVGFLQFTYMKGEEDDEEGVDLENMDEDELEEAEEELLEFEKKAKKNEARQKQVEQEGFKELQEQMAANIKETKKELSEDMLQLPSGAMISKESIFQC
jgi:hypothetical protein